MFLKNTVHAWLFFVFLQRFVYYLIQFFILILLKRFRQFVRRKLPMLYFP